MNAMQLLKYVTKINAPLGAINLATTVYVLHLASMHIAMLCAISSCSIF